MGQLTSILWPLEGQEELRRCPNCGAAVVAYGYHTPQSWLCATCFTARRGSRRSAQRAHKARERGVQLLLRSL